ncbi:acetoacetate--CoA ligase [Lentibacillus sp. Marseille-P4043]|uniref:acetoacetate--CoA ligase n=1 Tax=Lentibacillus sp. Marseille-P4043 TaxID=2040293 RepID=UPI000D0B49B6|nr:acetoacetate--CoA ligase [Lentibacillus sp. Marseille-P4043]
MVVEGEVLWKPSASYKKKANITKYMKWLKDTKELEFNDYNALWHWSVNELEAFWESIWEYFQVESATPYQCVLENKEMPGAKWFPGSTLNYVEHIMRQGEPDKVAIFHESEIRPLDEMTWGTFKKQVLILANELRKMGVKRGDRVAAYLPNIPETVVAMMASMSIGAVWSSCSPDFGSKSVLDRLQQIEPKVLFTIDGYKYAGKTFDRREEVRNIVCDLPSVEHIVHVPYLFENDRKAPSENAVVWSDLLNQPEIPFSQFEFEKVPFDHPLQIMYSSGTTGVPKAIVHSHGGILLESYKILTLHANLGPESRLLFYTTTGWMMFNILTSGLLTGSALVLYDGNPGYPHIGRLWEIAEKTKTTSFGASPMYVNLMKKAGLSPMETYDLSNLESIVLSGAPASPEVFEWIYENVKKDLWLSSQSGGTDICSGFVTGVPTEPVYAGEMQVRGLGVDVHSYTDDGKSIKDDVGELVVLQPMPSMPIYFWNDESNKRLIDSYYDMYPGIWRQGDNLKITSRGTCIIYGRSDSTLNRNGVRMGTSEIYAAVESLDEIQDSIIINLDLPNSRSFMPLFVVVKQGIAFDEALKNKINTKIRTLFSPKHVPDEIYQIQQVPYTLTGKKMEVPIRKIITGVPETQAAKRDAMANPTSLDYFASFAKNEFPSIQGQKQTNG